MRRIFREAVFFIAASLAVLVIGGTALVLAALIMYWVEGSIRCCN